MATRRDTWNIEETTTFDSSFRFDIQLLQFIVERRAVDSEGFGCFGFLAPCFAQGGANHDGFDVGETIIVEGLQRIRPGMGVSPGPAASELTQSEASPPK